jgi:hypothetical protein
MELSTAETVIAAGTVLSLILSTIAVVNSLTGDRNESRWLSRAQLTEAMGKMISLFGETAKLGHDVEQNPAYVQAVSTVLEHERNVYMQ